MVGPGFGVFDINGKDPAALFEHPERYCAANPRVGPVDNGELVPEPHAENAPEDPTVVTVFRGRGIGTATTAPVAGQLSRRSCVRPRLALIMEMVSDRCSRSCASMAAATRRWFRSEYSPYLPLDDLLAAAAN